MKFVYVSILLFTISLPAIAVDLPVFESHFTFDGNLLTLQQVRHQVQLVVASDDAKQVLNEFKKNNYTCRYILNNLNQCIKFLAEKPEDKEVRNAVISRNVPKLLHFEASTDDYALVNEGEALKEFEKNQKSTFDNLNFDKIHFYVIGDLKKFKIFDSKLSGSGEHFYMNSEDLIARQIQVSKTNKKTSSFVIEDKHIYLYEGVWKQ